MTWATIESAPTGRVVMTKIDDANGLRNEAALFRSSNGFWFEPWGDVYVYYVPTHWRVLTDDERVGVMNRIQRRATAEAAQAVLAARRVQP